MHIVRKTRGGGFNLRSIEYLPIPKHLEERVVVEVLPHIIEVIVLATSSNALLGVRSLRQLR